MNEALGDELERANQERQAIVKKYKLGRDLENNRVDQWVSADKRSNWIINSYYRYSITSIYRKTQTLVYTTRLTGDKN
jgi:hypothetical protein